MNYLLVVQVFVRIPNGAKSAENQHRPLLQRRT